MLVRVQPLRLIVVVPFVADKEGALNGTAVGVLVTTVEERLVDVDGSIGDGVVEGEDDHLRSVGDVETARNTPSIATAETVGRAAPTRLTRFRVRYLT